MVVTEKELFTYPKPADDVTEWPGTPIGLSNTITRTKSRTSVHDKTVDAKPGLREKLLNSAVDWIVQHPGKSYEHDVVIHGIRVRAYTNSDHLIDFWRDNWFSPTDWERMSGQAPPDQPKITVFALGGVSQEREAAYYSRLANMILFFNTSYYGQLKSWVLGAVGRVLADEYGIHSLHAAGVQLGDDGVLYIAPTGTGKSTSSYGLMELPNSRFHSDDWVYVRYVYQTKDGRAVSPREIYAPGGQAVRGYRCFRWLDEHPGLAAPLVGLTPDNEEISLNTTDLDRDKGVSAYTYISEKVFYLRTNLVENFPEAAVDIAKTKLENVPDVSPSFFEEHGEWVDGVVRSVMRSKDPETRAYFQQLGEEETRRVMARFFAFENARAMLDVTRAFSRDKVYSNPLEPLMTRSLFLLKRDFQDEVILERLPLNRFMERLLLGITPSGTREIAYNAYRATDDETERKLIATVEEQVKGTSRSLYEALLEHPDLPDSLLEEFELFRVMYHATAAFDLNTVIQKDPRVKDKAEAVRLTMKVIANAVAKRPEQARYSIENYRSFVGE